MEISVPRPCPIPSVKPQLLHRNAGLPAAVGLGGAKSPRSGGRRRRIAFDTQTLRRAAAFLSATLLVPPWTETPDLRLLLAGDGGSGGGRRLGFWSGGGWFGWWGRRRRSGTWLLELLVTVAFAAVLGSIPDKELAAGVMRLGLKKNKRAWKREVSVVALGFLVCFLIWSGLRRRRDGRLKWIRWIG